LVLFVSYPLLSPRTEQNTPRVHSIHAVISVTSAGLVWLFFSRGLDRPEFLYPYTLAFAAHLAIIGIARLKFDYPRMPSTVLLGTCILKGWLLLFVPFFLIEGLKKTALEYVIAAPLGVALAALAFYLIQPGLDDCPTDAPRWLRQASLAAVGSLAGLIPIYLP
jgi:phytol kinase